MSIHLSFFIKFLPTLKLSPSFSPILQYSLIVGIYISGSTLLMGTLPFSSILSESMFTSMISPITSWFKVIFILVGVIQRNVSETHITRDNSILLVSSIF